jgi:hypothetical protein
MQMLKILFYLVKNNFKNGSEVYRAAIQKRGTIDQAGIIRMMIFRGSSINESDILAVLRDYFDAIYEALLNGNSVTTPLANVRLSIRGNFDDTQDTFDPQRHEIVALVNPGVELKQQIKSKAVVQKEESLKPLPNPVQFRNLSNGRETNELVPGKVAQVTGKRLKFDPADPEQGIFLLNNGSTVRVEPDGKISNSELVFMVPTTLVPGEYRLEVRAKFGKSDIRSGRLAATLTVPVV